MPQSYVHNAGLPDKSKCRRLPEWWSINAPVVVRSFVPSRAYVVSIAHSQISIAHQSRRNSLVERDIESTDRQIDNLVYVLYG